MCLRNNSPELINQSGCQEDLHKTEDWGMPHYTRSGLKSGKRYNNECLQLWTGLSRPPRVGSSLHPKTSFECPSRSLMHIIVWWFPYQIEIQCTNGQRYWPTPLNHWIQASLVSWLQVYKIKPLPMQSAFTNTCKRMGRFKNLTEVQWLYYNGTTLLQQVSLLNFLPARKVPSEWFYCKVEVFTNHSNSVT